MKQPTKEEIREKAEQYCEKYNFSSEEYRGLVLNDLVKFAESLFQETEQETWHKVLTTSKRGTSTFEMAQIFHEERKKNENGH